MVDPVATPVTTPDDDTIAFAGVLLLQVPPVVLLLRDSVVPTQTELPPVIGESVGTGNTETGYVVMVEPHILVNV